MTKDQTVALLQALVADYAEQAFDAEDEPENLNMVDRALDLAEYIVQCKASKAEGGLGQSYLSDLLHQLNGSESKA